MRDPAVTLHWSPLPAGDVQPHAGFRVTTPVRTIVDVAATSPDTDQLARAVEEAREAGTLTFRLLRARTRSTPAPRSTSNGHWRG